MDSNYQKKYLKYKKKYLDIKDNMKNNMTGGTLGASASASADSSNLKLLIGLPEELIDKILAGIDLKGLQSLTKLDSEVLTRIALKHIDTRLNEIEYDLEKIINSKQNREPRIMQYISRINSDGEYRRTLVRRFEMKIDSFIDKFNELIRSDPRATPKSLVEFFDSPNGGNVYKVILKIKLGNPGRFRSIDNESEEIILNNLGDFNIASCSLDYDINNSGGNLTVVDCSSPEPKERMKYYVNRQIDDFNKLSEISLELIKYDYPSGAAFISENPSQITKIL